MMIFQITMKIEITMIATTTIDITNTETVNQSVAWEVSKLIAVIGSVTV